MIEDPRAHTQLQYNVLFNVLACQKHNKIPSNVDCCWGLLWTSEDDFCKSIISLIKITQAFVTASSVIMHNGDFKPKKILKAYLLSSNGLLNTEWDNVTLTK